MSSVARTLALDLSLYRNELIEQRRNILRYARSFPPGPERNQRRQVASSLRSSIGDRPTLVVGDRDSEWQNADKRLSLWKRQQVREFSMSEHVSIHRRIERQWAERIKSLKTIQGRIVVATERTLQRAFNGGALVPIKIRTDRRERQRRD
jgi:hypothetical protein